MASLPWGVLAAVLIIGVMLWVIIRQARSGAVNEYKVNEQRSVDSARKALAEADREIDRIDAADRTKRLRDNWTRD